MSILFLVHATLAWLNLRMMWGEADPKRLIRGLFGTKYD